ncbi:MAG: lysophospholipid acyltransferase family protein [Chthoniobacterales bacterium]
MKIEDWRARWLVAFGYRLLQVWARTLRFEIEDHAGVIGTPPNERYIGALWHNRLLLLPFVLQRYLPQRQGAALISASRDGAILADLVERFGFEVVRGSSSSSRKGASAIRQLAEVIARGRDVVITPDGPRGPAYELGQGIIFLAQQSGAEVVPMNMDYSSCWRVKSWDRFILPKPFSTIRVIFGPPHRVAPTMGEEDFERERRRLQDAMMELVEMR